MSSKKCVNIRDIERKYLIEFNNGIVNKYKNIIMDI